MRLSDNYEIVYDSNNVILHFHEMRTKVNRKTGKEEEYESTEDTYYPNLKIALKSFVQKSINGSESVTECLNRISALEKRIEEITEQLQTSNQ